MGNKRKICFIAPKAYPLFNESVKAVFGGAEVQLTMLAKELGLNSDYEVDFMVADYGQSDIEQYNDVTVWKSLDFKSSLFKQFITFFYALKKIDADVYIQRTLSLFSGIIGIMCRIRKKKFVYMVAHDNEVDGTHKLFQSNFLTTTLANLVFKKSDVIITQNSYQKSLLEKKGIRTELFKSSYKIENVDRSDKAGYHLWVSRSDRWKRPELFIKLARELEDESFVMVCPKSTDSNNVYYENLCRTANEVKNLKFIQYVPFSEIGNYFKNALTFVNTSTQEGFPNTFIQAAINKIPVVSLNVNPDNFINTLECGFYCKDSFEKLKDALINLVSDDELYNRLSQNIYKYAEDNHDIKNNAKLLKALIDKLLRLST